MLCAMHSLPVRPCWAASRTAFKASLGSGSSKPWHCARFGSTGSSSTAQAATNNANTWGKDLADVLREPEACVPRDTADKPLQAWQISRLQVAAAAGRRKVKVNDLAHELQLPRPEVLKYLKTNAPHTERSSNTAQVVRQRLTDAQPMEPLMQGLEWDIRNEAEKLQPRGSSQPEATTMPQPKSKKKKSGPAVPFVERQRQGSDFENKRLGRAVEATLERLYEESRRPSDETLQSVLQLLPLRKIADWFGQRRRMEASMNRDTQRR